MDRIRDTFEKNTVGIDTIDIISGDNKERLDALLCQFIDKMMAQYLELEREESKRKSQLGMPKEKYLASLWMVFPLLKLRTEEEIAEQLDVAYHELKRWNSERTFTLLTKWNYKEFLEYIIELYA